MFSNALFLFLDSNYVVVEILGGGGEGGLFFKVSVEHCQWWWALFYYVESSQEFENGGNDSHRENCSSGKGFFLFLSNLLSVVEIAYCLFEDN